MSEWITPDEVKEHHDNGYAAGVQHERERIIALLTAMGEQLIDSDAKISAKTMMLAINVIEGKA